MSIHYMVLGFEHTTSGHESPPIITRLGRIHYFLIECFHATAKNCSYLVAHATEWFSGQHACLPLKETKFESDKQLLFEVRKSHNFRDRLPI